MQAQPYNLGRLRLIRNHGQMPRLPVFITNVPRVARTFDELGSLGIHVRPDLDQLDWSPLAGVEVILMLPDTAQWTPLMQAIRAANPRRLRVLTEGQLTTLWRGRA